MFSTADSHEYPFESSFSASYAHMFAMMNDIVVHPAEHKFAMATQYASALQIFEWNEKDIRLLIEKDMEAPEYDMKDNSFQVNNRTKWGYLSSSGDEQFIYLLYSGAVQSQVKNPCNRKSQFTFSTGTAMLLQSWKFRKC